MLPEKQSSMGVVGATEFIEVAGHKNIPAKIDTGADSSSIWASHIEVTEDGILHFCLFGEGSPYYTGEKLHRADYKVIVIRNASGFERIRYCTHLSIGIGGRKIRALFSLADRSNNNFPVLVGRRTISGRFYVDVSKNHTHFVAKTPKSKLIQHRFKEDPYAFHRKYIEKLGGNVEKINLKQKGADHENSDTF